MPEWVSSFRVGLVVFIYVAGPFFIIWLYQRFRFLSKVGTVVMAYALGILLSLSGLTDPAKDGAESLRACQGLLQNLCVPLAIPLMLFSADFRSWLKHLKGTFVAFFCGLVAISAAVALSYLLFKGEGIAELDKAAGLMMGFYTGGTPNVMSLNLALQPSPETFLLVNTFEIFITFFLLAFLVAGGYRLVRKVLVYKPDHAENAPLAVPVPGKGAQAGRDEKSGGEISASDFENYSGMLKAKTLKSLLLPLACSVVLFAVAGGLSKIFVPGNYQVVSVVLLITTLAICLSFWPRLRSTPRMFEAGMYFILVFSIIIASDFQVSRVGAGASGLMLFILCVLVTSVLLHLLLAKLFKVDADLFTVSLVGLIFSPPFVPTVAGLMRSRRCLISGIVVGLLGYAVGNYAGIALYWLTRYL